MYEPKPEPYVIHLPSRKFVSKSVRLADQKAAEEGKIDLPKSKKTTNKKSYNKKSYYQKKQNWRQKKSNNWKKTSDDEPEKDITNDKPQKRLSLPSKSYSNRWNGNHNFYKQIEEAGVIATPAKKPGEDRGPFQRSFDTFMFGNRSILPGPPAINSEDSRLKYKSFKELSDSAVVSDKIYKYPVNDMTGTYQRSMTNARFGVASSSSTSEASISSRLKAPSMVPVLKNRRISNSNQSSFVPDLFNPTSTHSLNDDIFYSEDSAVNDSDSSLRPSILMEDRVTLDNNLKRIRDEPFNQMELKRSVAGPISCLPDLPPSRMEAIVSKTAEIPHESQILDHVMIQYRGKLSKGSNDVKNETTITEEQWFNMITLLDLPEMFMKEFIKNTMKILQEKSHSEKVGITIGQIKNIHSTKKVLTLRDYTGEIKALIQEKVIEAYRSMLCKNTILVLRNMNLTKFLDIEQRNKRQTTERMQVIHPDPTVTGGFIAADVAVAPHLNHVQRPIVPYPGPPPGDKNGKPHARIICEVANHQSIGQLRSKCQNWLNVVHVRYVLGIKLHDKRATTDARGRYHRSMTALLFQQGVAGYQIWDFGTHQLGRETSNTYLTGCNAPNIPAFQINIPVNQVFCDPPTIPAAAGYVPAVPSAVTLINFTIDLYVVQQLVLDHQAD
ncbi:hypothetical protein C1646_676552 [Rhizophagus diaphanus]|nr:hypothetical protein C1646_676552 [Rhizophagus diaphanus] [Rhizophagus sp. MUCL 43196]